MINEQFNHDDNFFRMVGAALVKTLHTSIGWINYFHDQKIRVVVPFYLSLPGSEKYLLDAFVDDIVDARIELNTDQVPRGVVTFNSFSTDITQFANPNEYLVNKREVNGKMKAFLQKTKAVPVKASYDVEIVLNSEIDVLKCSEKLLNTLFNYMFFNLDYYGMKIDAVFGLPDDKEIEIQREVSLDTEYKKRIKFPLTVETYYPIFLVEKDRYIDIDDFIICDNDDDLDWDRLYKKRPSEMDANDISSVRRVYWKSYIWDYDYRNDKDKLKGDNERKDTPPENF